MIFTALAALAVALVLLIVAVVKSSVAWGVGALVLSLLGSALLAVAYSVYRQRFGADDAEHADVSVPTAVVPLSAAVVAATPAGGPRSTPTPT